MMHQIIAEWNVGETGIKTSALLLKDLNLFDRPIVWAGLSTHEGRTRLVAWDLIPPLHAEVWGLPDNKQTPKELAKQVKHQETYRRYDPDGEDWRRLVRDKDAPGYHHGWEETVKVKDQPY